MIQNLAIASDHAGYKLKNYIVNNLKREINIEDFGTTNEESCDFPDFAKEACDFVVNNESYRGLLICGSGVGMSIAANKIKGIRAANVVDIETAKQSVEHNDVNVLCLGSKNVNEKNAMDIIEIFLETEFIQKEKYIRRVSKLEH
ncbi:MAG: RpiB/LacA/LacB family sugar-phosphate isomerase [Acidimicrobiaceae bacterium TMED210]|nr:MAG: RpiB/LacA/LacB family sugar-phosphate isomerase [Acidimicrobiaceae bacterium TMED210]|tara:strand:- start:15 stop:449 length:435 start_codon:yes stop_codon:yes gene_type:complete